jgi:hypothetical protein
MNMNNRIKLKKPVFVTREEKRIYFEKLDYNYDYIECYYNSIRHYMVKNNTIDDDNERIHLTYSKCLPIILLISSGNKEPCS